MPWAIRMTLMMTLVAALFQLYVARKTINAVAATTSWPKGRVRLTAIAILSWFILYPLLLFGSYYLGLGSAFRALQRSNGVLDAFLAYPFWLGIILSVQLALLFLIVDAAKLLLMLFHKKNKDRWLRVQSLLVISLACAGAVYVVARFYNDTFNLRTRETELRISNLPQELDGFRIVQVADLQADARTNGNKLQAFVDRVNGLKPDLVLFGGDLVTSGTDYIETGAEAVGKVEARFGIYACLGDHDFFSDQKLVTTSLEKNGVTVLNNVTTLVPVGSSFLSLTGITNVYRTQPPEKALETIEQQRTRGPVNILLTHQPSNWLVDYANDKGYDLFIAGHTHGGQIAFPLPGFLLTGSSFETNYVSGFYRVGTMLVSVTNGLGLTLAPVRYHAPAEVTLITLRAAK